MLWDMHLMALEKIKFFNIAKNQTADTDYSSSLYTSTSFNRTQFENRNITRTESTFHVYYCSSRDYKLLYWLDLFAAAIVPFSFMIVIDAVLIVSIFRSRQRIRLLVSDIRRISSKDRKFSITSISLNFVILIFNAPTTIFSMLHIGEDYAELPTVRLLQNFFHFLFYSHYALGFYIQLAVNSIIRKEFLRMMRLDVDANSGTDVTAKSSNIVSEFKVVANVTPPV